MSKADYVRSQGQTRPHHCHWPGCGANVPPAMWGCRKHWYMLPAPLRAKVWAAYRPGQEIDMRPSVEYLAVAQEVEDWILDNCPEAGTAGSEPAGTERRHYRRVLLCPECSGLCQLVGEHADAWECTHCGDTFPATEGEREGCK